MKKVEVYRMTLAEFALKMVEVKDWKNLKKGDTFVDEVITPGKPSVWVMCEVTKTVCHSVPPLRQYPIQIVG